LAQYEIARKIEKQVGVPKAYLACAIFFLVFLIVINSHGSDALCNLVGFVYPMYASFKSLKRSTSDDNTHWLTYWVCYGFLSMIEEFGSVLIDSGSWSTMYFVLKIAFIVWLFLPQTHGSSKVFEAVIKPLLNYVEANVDKNRDQIANVFKAAKQSVAPLTQDVKDKVLLGLLHSQITPSN